MAAVWFLVVLVNVLLMGGDDVGATQDGSNDVLKKEWNEAKSLTKKVKTDDEEESFSHDHESRNMTEDDRGGNMTEDHHNDTQLQDSSFTEHLITFLQSPKHKSDESLKLRGDLSVKMEEEDSVDVLFVVNV
ncbi:uncharacterized protein LOC144005072 isoform X2 [Festucalex cinctus]